MPHVNHCPKADEYLFKVLVLRAPIDYRAGHWGTLTAVLSVYEEAQPGIVEKCNCSSSTKHVLFPVASIRGDGH